jgi:transcriptional regulator with XRE-family HTH domain
MDERELYRELGRAIAGRRKHLEFTQQAVAKRAGMSRASLANIEVGRQKVLVHQLYGLAAALSLDSPARLLPVGRLEPKPVLGDVAIISETDLNQLQRAQIERVYRSVSPVRSDGDPG